MSQDYVEQHKVRVLFACIGIVIANFTSGCQTISTYDEHAYALQTSCLADILKLLDVADEPYSDNTDQIKAVTLNVERAYEYDRGRPLNQIQIAQWNIIRDPAQGSFAGFLAHWKDKGQLSLTYITEKKKQIAVQFDAITSLEAGKMIH
jgi:hypothetical protein